MELDYKFIVDKIAQEFWFLRRDIVEDQVNDIIYEYVSKGEPVLFSEVFKKSSLNFKEFLDDELRALCS